MMTNGCLCSFCPLKAVIAATLGCEVCKCIGVQFQKGIQSPLPLTSFCFAPANHLLCYSLRMVVLAHNFVFCFCFLPLVFGLLFVHSLYIFMVTQFCPLLSIPNLDPFLPPLPLALPPSSISPLFPLLCFILLSLPTFIFFSLFKTIKQAKLFEPFLGSWPTAWSSLLLLAQIFPSILSLPQFGQIQRGLRVVHLNLKDRQGKCPEIRKTRHPLFLKIFPRGQKREAEGNTI